jgi:hypothetical protein
MLHKEQYESELYWFRHKNTSEPEYVDIENVFIEKTFSPHMVGNDNLFGFISILKKMVVKLFDNHSIIRNFKNYSVNKYFYKHHN